MSAILAFVICRSASEPPEILRPVACPTASSMARRAKPSAAAPDGRAEYVERAHGDGEMPPPVADQTSACVRLTPSNDSLPDGMGAIRSIVFGTEKPGAPAFHDEGRQALASAAGARRRRGRRCRRWISGLLAVQPPARAVARGGERQRRDVGAGRLSDSAKVETVLARGDRRQIFLLLLGVPNRPIGPVLRPRMAKAKSARPPKRASTSRQMHSERASSGPERAPPTPPVAVARNPPAHFGDEIAPRAAVALDSSLRA